MVATYGGQKVAAVVLEVESLAHVRAHSGRGAEALAQRAAHEEAAMAALTTTGHLDGHWRCTVAWRNAAVAFNRRVTKKKIL